MGVSPPLQYHRSLRKSWDGVGGAEPTPGEAGEPGSHRHTHGGVRRGCAWEVRHLTYSHSPIGTLASCT
jgi:hypothetical protein